MLTEALLGAKLPSSSGFISLPKGKKKTMVSVISFPPAEQQHNNRLCFQIAKPDKCQPPSQFGLFRILDL